MLNKAEKKLVMDLCYAGSMMVAQKEIMDYCLDLIEEELDELDERELLDLIGMEDNIHPMEELDDVFCDMTVTEVLEDLCNIDLSHEWFSSDEKVSSNDIWRLLDDTEREIAQRLLDGEIDHGYDSIDRICEKGVELLNVVEAQMPMYQKAKSLFKKALEEDPEAVVNVLWIINE